MFYEYKQNNSGGSFDYNNAAGISHLVIIEADSAEQADERAEYIGLYFNGTDEEIGMDCPCCGDRWSPNSGWFTDQGSEVPEQYGQELVFDKDRGVFLYPNDFTWMSEFEGFVHYKDGNIVPILAPPPGIEA